ncbi:MAG: C69 family dipeptidase [Anaerolineales bacterium]|nr:C69 family dipeptidase [Anaerolineales bacterium]
MCDTFTATKRAAQNGVAVFGKNSDRPPNEGQSLVYVPAANHPTGSRVRCTYIEVPQIARTRAVLLSKPFWMWGAEMGINESGLVIGNEAIYSKIPANRKPALLGMDILRLALERSAAPREAIQVVAELLEEFGQGGNHASHGNSMYYHNSFLIANADDAWVMETVGKQWAAKQIQDVYSISNCLTIGGQYDLASDNLTDFAIEKKIAKSKSQFDFRKFNDFLFTTFGKGLIRRETTYCALNKRKGELDVEAMIAILRSHKAEPFDPKNGIAEQDVCMHASFGPIRISQSAASVAVHLTASNPIFFATGTSAPCLSVFKPFWADAASFLTNEPIPTATADSESLFWLHERLHREVLKNYPERLATFAAERDALEQRFVEGALKVQSASVKEREAFSAACYEEARVAEAAWLKRVKAVPTKEAFLQSIAWRGFNQKAEIVF